MAETTIEWADFTFNPWIGCTKVSPACDNCYAAAQDKFRKWTPEGWGGPRRRTSVANWRMPLKWNAEAAEMPFRPRVFCASLADVFDNQVPDEWRMDLFSLIAKTPNLDWLLLTKRIGNVMPMCSRDGLMFDMIGERIWLGATIANQEEADRDIPKLLAVPARVRFLSMEPLLGPVDIGAFLHRYNCTACGWMGDQCALSCAIHGNVGVVASCPECDGESMEPRCPGCGAGGHAVGSSDGGGLDWVITGGESGPGARPSHPDWFRSLRDQCQVAGVPFLFKQWGEWFPISHMADGESDKLYRSNRIAGEFESQGAIDELYGRTCKVPTMPINYAGETSLERAYQLIDGHSGMLMFKLGKKAAGRLLDCRTWDGFPEVQHG